MSTCKAPYWLERARVESRRMARQRPARRVVKEPAEETEEDDDEEREEEDDEDDGFVDDDGDNDDDEDDENDEVNTEFVVVLLFPLVETLISAFSPSEISCVSSARPRNVSLRPIIPSRIAASFLIS